MSNTNTINRGVLTDDIPLAVPYMVYLDVTNKCNFSCSFCPTGNDLQKKISNNSGRMTFELFEKIISDFVELTENTGKKIKKLGLFMMGEPLLHTKIDQMIKEVKKANIVEHITMSTNGALLNEKMIIKLCNSGIDEVSVSMYGTNNSDYIKVNKKFSFDQVISNVSNFKKIRNDLKSNVTITLKYFEETDELKSIKNELLKHCDTIAFEQPFNWNKVYSDNSNFIPLANVTPAKYCASPWFVMAIGWDGTVLTCCADWMWETKVGDLRNQTVSEVWNGKGLHNFKKQIAEGRQNENKACKGCTYYLVNTPPESNIDNLIQQNPEKALQRNF